jgi:hypothetical protein
MTGSDAPHLWRQGVILGLGLMLIPACEDRPATGPATRSPPVQPVGLSPLPPRLRETCVRVEVLAARCPAELPVTETRYRVRELDYGTDSYRVVEFAANAPYPRIGHRNAPPRFAHVVLKGGDLSKAFYFEWPSGPVVHVVDALEGDRQTPLMLDTQSWAARRGTLVLAPAFPAGGVDADHLIYRWAEDGREYALSLHAWRPIDECVATLRVLVESVE